MQHARAQTNPAGARQAHTDAKYPKGKGCAWVLGAVGTQREGGHKRLSSDSKLEYRQ